MKPEPDIDETIITAVLKVFRETLKGNIDFEWSDQLSIAPEEGFIALRTYKKRSHPYSTETPIRQWRITPDIVEEIDADFQPPLSNEVEGMFSKLFMGWFELHPNQDKLIVGWQTGPRFGRGLIYDIEFCSNTGYSLGGSKVTWMS